MATAPLRERDRELQQHPRSTATPPRSKADRAAPEAIRIVVKRAGGVSLLPVTDVECLEADGNAVIVHAAGGERYRIRESLSHMFEQLQGHGFIRVHRGTVVSVAAITGIEKGRYRKAHCVLRGGGRFEIGRVEFHRLRALWQPGVLDLGALTSGLTLLSAGAPAGTSR